MMMYGQKSTNLFIVGDMLMAKGVRGCFASMVVTNLLVSLVFQVLDVR